MALEKELKWRLNDRADWLRLRSLFGDQPIKVLHQVNIYLDTEKGYFASQRSMLRLRQENNRWILGYKCGLVLDNGYFSATEIEDVLNDEEAERLKCGSFEHLQHTKVFKYLKKQNFTDTLHIVGQIKNDREVWSVEVLGVDRSEHLELDYTEFNEHYLEYELELETNDPQFYKDKIESLDINMREQTATKYERFLQYLAKDKPIISCVMPIYNCEATLDQAIRSVIWQNFTQWELILVDDGSDDHTLDIASQWSQRDKRIKIVVQEHGGIVKALNRGLQECRGQFVARMDGDDISHPQRFREQYQYLQKNPQIDLVGCKVRLFPRKYLTEGMLRYERWLNITRGRRISRDIFVESPLVHPSVMFRTKLIEEGFQYEEGNWPEDYQLWFRLWLQGKKFAKIDKVLFYWRDLPNRLTRLDFRCNHQALRRLKLDLFTKSYWGKDNHYAVPDHKRHLIIWGAGRSGKAVAKEFKRMGIKVEYFTDILPARHGQTICGLKVLALEDLPEPHNYFLLTAVGNPNSREEIRQYLRERGWQEGKDFCCLAGLTD
ncbi:glycosyltransferase [bacterium]|nr:glycosyltransferase [bacterium]